MPPINIQKKMKDEPNFARTLRSRSFETLTQDQCDEILGMMGEVMSMRKLNRKVALLATIQYEMQFDEPLSAEQVAERMNKIMIPQNSVKPNHVGCLMKVMEKWGFIRRYRRTKHNRYEYIRVK